MGALIGNIRSKARLATQAAVFLFFFSLYGLYCINTVNEVKINGPIYREIVTGKDVIADVLPPPEYLVETYLTAYQLLDEQEPSEIARLAQRAENLRSDYLARHAYWAKTLPPGAMRNALVDSSFAPAQRALEAMAGRFLPAIRRGDKAAARSVLDGEIRPAYEAHRKRIDAVVELGRAQNLRDEEGAALAVHSRIYGQVVIGILLFVFLCFFSSYVVSVERKAGEEAAGTRG